MPQVEPQIHRPHVIEVGAGKASQPESKPCNDASGKNRQIQTHSFLLGFVAGNLKKERNLKKYIFWTPKRNYEWHCALSGFQIKVSD